MAIAAAHNSGHRAEQLASGMPALLVAAERVAATIVQGVHGRRRVGSGETFWQYRRYQSGDSAGAITSLWLGYVEEHDPPGAEHAAVCEPRLY